MSRESRNLGSAKKSAISCDFSPGSQGRFSARSENPSLCCRSSAPENANPTSHRRSSSPAAKKHSAHGDSTASKQAQRGLGKQNMLGNRRACGEGKQKTDEARRFQVINGSRSLLGKG